MRVRALLRACVETTCQTMEEPGDVHSHSRQEQVVVPGRGLELRIGHCKPEDLNTQEWLASSRRVRRAALTPEEVATVLLISTSLEVW